MAYPDDKRPNDLDDAVSITPSATAVLVQKNGELLVKKMGASAFLASGAPASHASTHKHGGSDETATATPGANVIPKAGAGGTLAAGFLPAATTSVAGAVVLATPGSDVAAGHVIQASDARMSDARTPTGSASGDLSSSFPNPIVISTHLSAPMPVNQGGTGNPTLTAHGVLIGNGVSAVNVTGAGSSGQVLTSNGASADPSFQAPAASGETNTASNVGSSGVGTFDNKTGVDLRFRKINAASSRISVALNSQQIDLDVPAATIAAPGVVTLANADGSQISANLAVQAADVRISRLPVEPWKRILHCDHMTGRIDARWLLVSGAFSSRNGESGHPGIGRLAGLPAAGEAGIAFADDDASSSGFLPADITRVVTLLRITSINDVVLQFGVSDDQPDGPNAVLFRWDTAGLGGLAWQFRTSATGTATNATASSGLASNSWVKLELRRVGSSWEFYVDDTLKATNTTNLPSVAVRPFFYVVNNHATVGHGVEIDFLAIESVFL